MWPDLLTKPLTNKKKFADCRSIIMNCYELPTERQILPYLTIDDLLLN